MNRAILDANIAISYLLNPSGDGPPAKVVRAAVSVDFVLLASPKLLHEIRDKVTNKPYLARRISLPAISELFDLLAANGEVHDDDEIVYPAISRDRKDDYLLTNAVIHHVDYLVTGDKDLLVLSEFEGVQIVSPAEFAQILAQ